MATQPKKLTYYSLPYTEFVRDPDNYRQDVDAHIEETNLLELIKADGGVRDPIFVLPSEFNIDGKRVINEGSSRHRCIELLSQDQEYLEKGGKLDINYILIPKEVVSSPSALIKFKLSSNSIDKRISSVEQWNGIKELLDIFEQDPECQNSEDPRHEATSKVAEFLGRSKVYIVQFRRVFETRKNERILELVSTGVIPSIETADIISAEHNKLLTDSNISIDEFIEYCQDTAREKGKATLGKVVVQQAAQSLRLPAADLLPESNKDSDSEFESNDPNSESADKVETESNKDSDSKNIEFDENDQVIDAEWSINQFKALMSYFDTKDTTDSWNDLSENDLIKAGKKALALYEFLVEAENAQMERKAKAAEKAEKERLAKEKKAEQAALAEQVKALESENSENEILDSSTLDESEEIKKALKLENEQKQYNEF